MMKRSAVNMTAAAQFGALRQELTQTLGFADLSESLKECSQLADQAFGANFAAQAGPHSGQWPERKDKSTGGGRTIGDGHPLEIKTGELFLAVTSPFGRGHVEDVGFRSAEIGVDPSEIPYAMAQNYGYAGRNLPQREFVDIDDETADKCEEIMADGMLEQLMDA